MKGRKRFQVQLSKQERQESNRLLSGGLQPVRTVLRALALRQLAEGPTIRQVAASVRLKTVWLVSQRYQQQESKPGGRITVNNVRTARRTTCRPQNLHGHERG